MIVKKILWNFYCMRKQKIFFSSCAIKSLLTIPEFKVIKKIFIVSGANSYLSTGVKEFVEQNLKKYELYHFSGFRVNPKLEDVLAGIELFNKFNPELTIAIGGGSTLDMAKLINFLAVQNHDCEMLIKQQYFQSMHKPLKLIAIPTTSGSGSESTKFATIYIDFRKFSVEHDFLLPDYVILDSKLTLTMAPSLAATSGMDAFAQAIESYWSVNSNKLSKIYSARAIKIILNSLVKSVQIGSIDFRSNMSKAANLAGRAINITKTTAPHALSYPITSHFGIPHGHAVAIFLPAFFIINSGWQNLAVIDKRGKSYIKKNMSNLCKIMGCSNVVEASLKIKQIMKLIGLSNDLKEYNLDLKILKKLIKSELNLERLSNNPIKISNEIIDEIFDNKFRPRT